MLNNKPVDVQTLEVSVALGVSQKLEQKLGTLLGPASLGSAPCLALGLTTDASVETTEWDDFLLNNDVLEETLGTAKRHSLDGLSGLSGVLEVHPEIAASRLAGLGWVLGFRLVPRHLRGRVGKAWKKRRTAAEKNVHGN